MGIIAVLLWVVLGVLLIIPWQASGVLVAVSIGIPTLLLHYEREKSSANDNRIRREKEPKEEQKQQATLPILKIESETNSTKTLMPDKNEITKLRIDGSFLDKLYEDSRSRALKTYNDAQLSYFAVQAHPFDSFASICIYFSFYSKWSDRICDFQYSSLTSDLKHYLPNKQAKFGF